jgi:hypothetical protein
LADERRCSRGVEVGGVWRGRNGCDAWKGDVRGILRRGTEKQGWWWFAKLFGFRLG